MKSRPLEDALADQVRKGGAKETGSALLKGSAQLEEKSEKPADFEQWVEQELSHTMMRRLAGEDVNLTEIPSQAPPDLVEKSLNIEDPEVSSVVDEHSRLMREALEHSDPNNPYSVWLERDRRGGRGARSELEIMLSNPDRLKLKIENGVKAARAEKEKKRNEAEQLESPYLRVGRYLRVAREELIRAGLPDDAAQLVKVIQKAETASPADVENLTLDLWNGNSYEDGKIEGWYPSDKARRIITRALGAEYGTANSQIGPTKIKYWSSLNFTDGVKFDAYDNRILGGPPGNYSYARLVFPKQWFDKRKEIKSI
ncbi:MAG: hypothetical protein Q8O46_01705 [bacterium]|nr:hypothetical protein [bacterium]